MPEGFYPNMLIYKYWNVMEMVIIHSTLRLELINLQQDPNWNV